MPTYLVEFHRALTYSQSASLKVDAPTEEFARLKALQLAGPDGYELTNWDNDANDEVTEFSVWDVTEDE